MKQKNAYSFKKRPPLMVSPVCGHSRSTMLKMALSLIALGLATVCHASRKLEDIAKVRESAEKGNSDTQYELGWRYVDGVGVEQNATNAVAWFEKAADAGDSFAQMMLAVMYLQGKGTEYNKSESIKWFQRAIENGLEDRLSKENTKLDSHGKFVLSVMYNAVSNTENTVFWLRKSANMGYAKAQYELGLKYLSGAGVKKDLNEATEWFQRAAENGYAAAQTNLGYAYATGEGRKQDFSMALTWYRKAAESGDAVGQFNLGYMYYEGAGVSPDYSESRKWWRLAAAHGHADSAEMIRRLDREIAETEKIRDLAETGDVDAQLKLARCYETGMGVERNYQEAAKLYRTAAYGFKGRRYSADFWGFILWGFVVAFTCKLLDDLWERTAEAIEAVRQRRRFRDSICNPDCGEDVLREVDLPEVDDQAEGESLNGESHKKSKQKEIND